MKTFILAVAVVAVLALEFYWVFIADGLAPRTTLGAYFDIGTENQFDLSHLDEWNAAAKKKYGPAAVTAIRTHTGSADWEVHLGDSVTEIKPLRMLFRGVYGVLMVTDQGTVKGHFPFEVTADPTRTEDARAIVDKIKTHLGAGHTPALQIDNLAWWIADCHAAAPPRFLIPGLGALLGLRVSDVCVVQFS